jgi:two-component system cell cycle sensor histidine kinase/response regulator CckA
MMLPDKLHSVLIVEDERIIARDLQQTLAAMGYDAFAIASSADEALSRASERCPDLVLMDIRIKGPRDGIETATLLRGRFGVPVVYLTAHADEATIQRAKHSEPYGYLMKPARSAELRSTIEISIHKHGAEKQLRDRERWFSTTLRSIADAVITVDLAGAVSFMNAAAEALTGVTAAAAIGRPVRDLVRLPRPAQPSSVVDQIPDARSSVVADDGPLAAAAGAGRTCDDRGCSIIAGGERLGAALVFQELTEEDLERHQRELAARLATLGAEAAGVAREVNSPLAVVVANAAYALDALRRRQSLDHGDPRGLAEAIQAVRDLASATDWLAKIVTDLQAAARPAPAAA